MSLVRSESTTKESKRKRSDPEIDKLRSKRLFSIVTKTLCERGKEKVRQGVEERVQDRLWKEKEEARKSCEEESERRNQKLKREMEEEQENEETWLKTKSQPVLLYKPAKLCGEEAKMENADYFSIKRP